MTLPPAHHFRMLPMRIVPRAELFSHRVCCSYQGCSWSCPVRDADDAVGVLELHLTITHAPHAPRTN
jgi:hypothetical protein